MEEHPQYAYVGLNVADDEASAENFVEVSGWTWPQIKDFDRRRAIVLGAEYQPHVVVLDPEGEIVDRLPGEGNPAAWQALADRVEARRSP